MEEKQSQVSIVDHSRCKLQESCARTLWQKLSYFLSHLALFCSSPLYWIKFHRRPKKGSAIIFFPAAGGIPNVPFDVRTLHAGEAVAASAKFDKWIAQLWLRDGTYAPTAPAGNTHAAGLDAIHQFCQTQMTAT